MVGYGCCLYTRDRSIEQFCQYTGHYRPSLTLIRSYRNRPPHIGVADICPLVFTLLMVSLLDTELNYNNFFFFLYTYILY